MQGEWLKVFTGLDSGALVSIVFVAFVLHRWTNISIEATLVLTMGIGALWGISDGLGTFDPQKGHYALVAYVFHDALMYGAGAAANAVILSRMLDTFVGPSSRSAPKG